MIYRLVALFPFHFHLWAVVLDGERYPWCVCVVFSLYLADLERASERVGGRCAW